jgi:predicted TIM-barrel fold metal-dependent hydrolase
VPGIAPPPADYPLDTTRAAINLVRTGAVRRFPAIKFILAHAGGFVPYQPHRMAGWLATYGYGGPRYHAAPQEARAALAEQAMVRMEQALDDLASFYFDVAMSSTSATLPSLLAFAKPGHVLFGSDWPFVPDRVVRYFVDQLTGYEGLDAEQRHALDRGNAVALFPRLARADPPLPRQLDGRLSRA